MSFNSNEEYCFLRDFPSLIEGGKTSDKADHVLKLIDAVPKLLNQYPSDIVVIETVCVAITQASVNTDPFVAENDGILTLTKSLINAISQVHMTTQSPHFVRIVFEAAVRLLALFPSLHLHLELIKPFLSQLFNSFSQNGTLILATSIPSNLPSSVYTTLLEAGAHDSIRSVISLYEQLDEVEFSKLLSTLSSFLKAEPSCASSYLLDSTHFLLLFAAQKFSGSLDVQAELWNVLTILVNTCQDFSQELTPSVLVPAILPNLKKDTCTVVPMLTFIASYILVSQNVLSLILYCFNENPDFIHALIRILNTTRELDTELQKDEVSSVAEFFELFFEHFKKQTTAHHILDSNLLHHLGQAAIKWPELCCVSFCTALRKLLGHFLPDLSSLHPALRKLLVSMPDKTANEKEIFYKENQLLPFVDLLSNPATFNSLEIRGALYDTIKILLKSAPNTVKNEWLTDEFLNSFVSNLLTDVKKHKPHMHIFVFLAHFIAYTVKSERMSVLRDQKWHHVAIECLKVANYGEACSTCFGFVSCILFGYSQSFKDIMLLTDSEMPEMLTTYAEDYGVGLNSRAGENFGSLILTITADKASSVVLHKKGFLTDLYPLIDDQYDPQIIRPAIHAIGNIALAGHHVKQEVLDNNIHDVLIAYLDSKMSSADPSVLSACCRVLHILASGDWAKRNFAEKGLVDVLLRMLETRRDNAEVCWRPLGLLSSLGFMSLSHREYVITEKVLKSVLNVLKSTNHSKVKSYTALVFLASVDSDRRSADLQRMKVTEIFQQVLEQTKEDDASYDDLKRWGSSLLEKGQLFTIPLNSSQLKQDEMELLASCMEQSILWPERPHNVANILTGETVDGVNKQVTLLPQDNESNYSPKFPEGPSLTDNAVGQILQLGLDPKRLFRIGRFFGSSHGLCSNCEKDGRSEEIVFRPQSLTPDQYQQLITRGWYRRGGVKLYRYRYNHNLDCSDWETRVLISKFDYKIHKSYKKVLRRMPEERLTIETVPTQFLSEAYELYNSYHIVKHDKPKKSEYSYCEHAVNSPFKNQSIDGFQYGTFHQLYRLDGKLVAVGVIDIVPNGVVSIYMWYDMCKEVLKYSFGVYSALKEIEFAKELSKCNPSIKYYYMQGWNGNNQKLSYKARYEPEEFYNPCTVTDWVFGLDGVKREQEIFTEKWLRENKQPSLTEDTKPSPSLTEDGKPSPVHVPGDAISFDRITYKALTGLDRPEVMNTVVCLNHQLYMYFGQMLDVYSVNAQQRQLMIERFEELVFAVGPELARNMVIDIVACSTTGDIQEYVF